MWIQIPTAFCILLTSLFPCAPAGRPESRRPLQTSSISLTLKDTTLRLQPFIWTGRWKLMLRGFVCACGVLYWRHNIVTVICLSNWPHIPIILYILYIDDQTRLVSVSSATFGICHLFHHVFVGNHLPTVMLLYGKTSSVVLHSHLMNSFFKKYQNLC